VGRYANRIGKAAFELDGVRYQIVANEPPNVLHGGPEGFFKVMWDVISASDTEAVLHYTSPDSEQGFPGTLQVQATFRIRPDGVEVEYLATTDAPTVVALTTHPYFNLAGEGSINDHLLQIHADGYTAVAADLIPTGEIIPVAGTAFDFREPRLIGAARKVGAQTGTLCCAGFDNNFCVNGDGLREQLRLTSPDGLQLTVLANTPGIQIYDGSGFDGTLSSPEGVPYQAFAGVAIEPQAYPDSPNHPEFPSTVLRPGEEYRQVTQWVISQTA
jgi:aldose 1-epimerase